MEAVKFPIFAHRRIIQKSMFEYVKFLTRSYWTYLTILYVFKGEIIRKYTLRNIKNTSMVFRPSVSGGGKPNAKTHKRGILALALFIKTVCFFLGRYNFFLEM